MGTSLEFPPTGFGASLSSSMALLSVSRNNAGHHLSPTTATNGFHSGIQRGHFVSLLKTKPASSLPGTQKVSLYQDSLATYLGTINQSSALGGALAESCFLLTYSLGADAWNEVLAP